ncbi:O-linked N-acetylglucosamine transferase, SPINDLY family protein [Rhizobium paknamense]|uniref:O-linked N-acetylglucosamine transferase (SPINDLY family) n=1 Tax=Rhizobium paknamense TaxID=1206817 RepID=A0ABU0I814_9HYPH|nr:hypothetical protein [Rhizobium paknamense]MDQ0453802.1 putative O-linked N-acetylglucosamine transferase (SPINDLY family) [Rhizobium paknamense]
MTDAFQKVVQAYRNGAYDHCLTLAAPLLRSPKPHPALLLMAAQASVKLERNAEAAHYYEKAADVHQAEAPTLLLMAARLLFNLHQKEAALALMRRSQAMRPFDVESLTTFRRLLREQAYLDEIEAGDAELLALMQRGAPQAFLVDDPHEHIMWCADEALNGLNRRMPTGTAFTAESRSARRAMPHAWAERIRIGYLSNDVSDQHATMILFRGVLASHDPARFDVTLFCYTDPDVAATDQGFRTSCPNLVSITDLDDESAAEVIRARGIDILVDLKGHTRDARVDLVNRGLAPVQAAYLGFPGSAYGIDCDYVIGDRIVLADGMQPHYHEAFCRLPECYQSNDAFLRPLPEATLRSQLGLPEEALILASFNGIRKLNAATLRSWATILRSVPNAVLWMMCGDAVAQRNILTFLDAHGVASHQVAFATRANYASHIARLRAADLALDSHPYNGHTTTSDALWAGLPVIARRGSNFASRVSESLLSALNVPELLAEDEAGYEALAIELATDTAKRLALRKKIEANRFMAPLFDTERFTRHLERAYEMMVERQRAGLAPAAFDVPALPVRTEPFQP